MVTVVSLAGMVPLRMLADRVGLTESLSRAFARRGLCRFMIGVGCWWTPRHFTLM